MNTNIPRALTAGIYASAILLGACGSDDAEGTPSSDAPVDAAQLQTLQAEVIEVGLVDFAFVGLPDVIPAGSQLAVRNDAPGELHELAAFRVPDDEARSAEELIGLPPGELMPLLGEPTAVLIAAPGGEMIPAVGDGTLQESGRYLIICAIPTGVDPETYLAAAATSDGPPEVEGGPPHLAHGMWAQVVVE